jgi:hypothetical protein
MAAMASRGKKKTTMAKLTREARLRERRVEKQARKNARKELAAVEQQPGDADGLEYPDAVEQPDAVESPEQLT